MQILIRRNFGSRRSMAAFQASLSVLHGRCADRGPLPNPLVISTIGEPTEHFRRFRQPPGGHCGGHLARDSRGPDRGLADRDFSFRRQRPPQRARHRPAAVSHLRRMSQDQAASRTARHSSRKLSHDCPLVLVLWRRSSACCCLGGRVGQVAGNSVGSWPAFSSLPGR